MISKDHLETKLGSMYTVRWEGQLSLFGDSESYVSRGNPSALPFILVMPKERGCYKGFNIPIYKELSKINKKNTNTSLGKKKIEDV